MARLSLALLLLLILGACRNDDDVSGRLAPSESVAWEFISPHALGWSVLHEDGTLTQSWLRLPETPQGHAICQADTSVFEIHGDTLSLGAPEAGGWETFRYVLDEDRLTLAQARGDGTSLVELRPVAPTTCDRLPGEGVVSQSCLGSFRFTLSGAGGEITDPEAFLWCDSSVLRLASATAHYWIGLASAHVSGPGAYPLTATGVVVEELDGDEDMPYDLYLQSGTLMITHWIHNGVRGSIHATLARFAGDGTPIPGSVVGLYGSFETTDCRF